MNMNKSLVIAVIILFIGLAFAPSINANISKDLVEFTTEICGLDGRKQTVKLTREKAEEVEGLFYSIKKQLNAIESIDEAEEIFKDAVMELDKYGLLGGLSVKQVLRLINRGYQRHRTSNPIDELLMNKGEGKALENKYCFISGMLNSDRSRLQYYVFFNVFLNFIGYPIFLNWLRNYPHLWYMLLPFNAPILIMAGILPLRFAIPRQISPLKVGIRISFGLKRRDTYTGGISYEPAEGWVNTIGVYGEKNWNSSVDGPFYGDIYSDIRKSFFWHNVWCVGADYFSGIYIRGDEKTSFIGYCRRFSIVDKYPFN